LKPAAWRTHAQKGDGQDQRSVAGNVDVPQRPGAEHDDRDQHGQAGAEQTGGKEEADGKVRKVEDAVDGVAQLFGESPTAAAFAAREALIGDEHLAVTEPEQQTDYVGVGLAQAEQAVAHLAGAAEDINAAGGHFGEHEAAVEAPEETRSEFGEPGVGPFAADAKRDIRAAGGKNRGEPRNEGRGLLQVGGEDGEVVALAHFETGADRRKRAEVAA